MTKYIIIIIGSFLVQNTHAQGRFMPTCFPSLLLPVDARSAGLAGAGTALDGDISSINSNPARLAMLEGQHHLAFDFLPFPSIAKDVNKVGLKYAYTAPNKNSFSLAVNYFSAGNITLRNDVGADILSIKQSDYNITIGYGMQVVSNGYLGASLRYLYQSNLINLTDNNLISGGAAMGGDIGYLHNLMLSDHFERLRIGISLQNIGSKLNGYLYQPMNLSFGTTYSNGYFDEDKRSTSDIAYLLGIQIDKPLVPSMPLYDASGKIIAGLDPTNRSIFSNLFTTWADAPGGIKENIKQIRYAIFSEVLFNKILALRAGYAHENPDYGNRSYLSIGAGLNWNYQGSDYKMNLAYLQPIGPGASYSPLKNSFSLQFLFDFGEN
jgi:hypothetical protein